MLRLLVEWDAEDATDDASELDRRDAEWLDFRCRMNAGRAGGRVLFPEVCDPPAGRTLTEIPPPRPNAGVDSRSATAASWRRPLNACTRPAEPSNPPGRP